MVDGGRGEGWGEEKCWGLFFCFFFFFSPCGPCQRFEAGDLGEMRENVLNPLITEWECWCAPEGGWIRVMFDFNNLSVKSVAGGVFLFFVWNTIHKHLGGILEVS